jgi:hypothetical protein
MGQTITVSARPGSRDEVRIFDLNRSLTGMAIERYTEVPAEGALRPPDVLARRLFAIGATAVTVYSSSVTVEAPASSWATLEATAVHTIEHLFNFYGDDAGWSFEALGVEPKASPVQ